MTAVYNENDPAAATWLRELIANNLIAPGDVDERSIKDVSADDYRDYGQVHCFAGIGLWSAALRKSGWPDDRPVGTGSCPCQPFSQAGKNLGFADPRHLWPDWRRIVDEAREQGQPWADTILGEQVSSAGEWQSLVQSDLEDRGYAFGTLDLPAAGFAQGAHIRQRFYWVADRHNAERWSDLAGGNFGDWPQTGRIEGYGQFGAGESLGGLADNGDAQQLRRGQLTGGSASQSDADGTFQRSSGLRASSGLADGTLQRQRQEHADAGGLAERDRTQGFATGPHSSCTNDRLGDDDARRQGWRFDNVGSGDQCAIRAASVAGDVDWLLCRDGKIRPVEAGTFPLASSNPGRLGLLRGYGNGLDLETAVNFIGAYMEACEIAAVMSEYT